jgi:hypothetical protein
VGVWWRTCGGGVLNSCMGEPAAIRFSVRWYPRHSASVDLRLVHTAFGPCAYCLMVEKISKASDHSAPFIYNSHKNI